MSLNRLNPCLNQSDTILSDFFPNNINFYNNIIQQEKFREFLKSDGTKIEGRRDVATYYNVLDDWNKLDHACDFITDYYSLLILVKRESHNNNVWISFIEGQNQHAAIVACLLCAKFDFDKNILTPDFLSFSTFKEALISHLQSPDEPSFTPKNQLCDILKSEAQLCMLRTPISVLAYIPSNNTGDVDKLFNALKKLSALVSTKKGLSNYKQVKIDSF